MKSTIETELQKTLGESLVVQEVLRPKANGKLLPYFRVDLRITDKAATDQKLVLACPKLKDKLQEYDPTSMLDTEQT